ncbi:zona pellucida sperm-binding protein 4-like [Osmerus eperlanus]|uniref:zona pellucida sperm-binding protein 4-like n=1 Tax=Osmerus eperlanus TaxID=29151 RepID=UPI002E0EB6E9
MSPVFATLSSIIGVQNPQTPPNCDVEQSVKITCGSGITSAAGCTAINCCFDGQRCFYGKLVTVQATKDGQIVVVVSKEATLPTLDLTSVRLRNDADPQCRPIAFNSVFIVFQFAVTACGTSVMEGTDFIVYENSMESSYDVSFGPLGYITRDSYFKLAFQIRYTGMSVQTLTVEILDKNNPLDVYGEGPLNLELRLANGQCTVKGCSDENMYYSSYYGMADYPITKVLRDPVYVEVRVKDKTDSSVVLILNRCWATNSPTPHSMPQWDLLVGGCPNPNDNKYLTTLVQVGSSPNVQFPSHYKRFVVKMFTFIDQSTRLPMTNQVFFHCSATVCHSSVANCAQSCLRKRRDVSEEPRTDDPRASTGVVVSSGAVILTEGSIEQLE